MNIYLIFILTILLTKYALEFLAEALDIRQVKPANPPEEFRRTYIQEKYRRSQLYSRERSGFSIIRSTINMGLVITFILLGGFNFLDRLARSWVQGPILTGLIYFLMLVVLSGILDLPIRIYTTFVIEEKFGFNRSTASTFILDLVKGFLLLVILGGPVMALVLWFFQKTGKLAPLIIWIAVSGFQFFLTFIAPVIILPLFNRFIPLEIGELRTSIEKYAREQGFSMKGIYTMDGSKRSAKTNAFFTGFGKSRRIVFFDTLMEKHSQEELISILAHEMGHYKLGHVLKMMIISILETGLLLFLLSFFINNPGLFAAFKMERLSIYASLIFFGFLYTPIATFLSIIQNMLSRAYEYQADHFAVRTTGESGTFVTVLKKLSADNLSNLFPHPLKVFLSYSHPPVLKRIEAIRKSGGNRGQ
jgi:STE24 endopeptidase